MLIYFSLTAAAAAAQSCPTVCDPTDGSPRGSAVPGKNTGVGCHFLLQCIKVKSESEVTQSCPTPSDPMDCSPPGSSVHGICQARVLEWGAIAFSGLVICVIHEICPFHVCSQMHCQLLVILINYNKILSILPLLFLISTICVFSLLVLIRVARGFSILLIFSNNQLEVS